jgi:hypothetical protein
MSLTVVPLEQPKRLHEFQEQVEKLIDSGEFGRLSVAETIGVLQVVIMNLWRRFNEEVE